MYVFAHLEREDIMTAETKTTNCGCELNEKERSNRYCCHCGKANNLKAIKWMLKPDVTRSRIMGADKHELLWLDRWTVQKNDHDDTYRLIGTPANRMCDTYKDYITLTTHEHDEFIAQVAKVWPQKAIHVSSISKVQFMKI